MSERSPIRADVGVAFILFALIAAAGVGLAGIAVQDFSRARASLAWPPVVGIVLSRSGSDTADIRYAYVAGGSSHESRRVRFLTGLAFPAPTSALRPGDSVTAFVDPDDPGFAVLRPGGSGPLFALALLVAGAMTFIGFAGIIRTLSGSLPERQQDRRLSA